jgi:hypothetical protein
MTINNLEDAGDVRAKLNATEALAASAVQPGDALSSLDTSVTGAQLDAMLTKLDTITEGADVVDENTVEAVGALMDGDFPSIGLLKGTDGSGTYTQVTTTTYGEGLIALADQAALQAAVGVAAVGLSGDYSDLSGTPTISGFGATLIDDADQATARATLGLGSAATQDSTAFAIVGHTHGAADIVSGTFASARISEASVVQHEGALDALNLTNGPAEANATADQTGAEMVSAIDTELAQTRWKAVEVPAGGTTGQRLTKASGTDFDTEWTTDPTAPDLAAVELTDAATIAWDMSTGVNFEVTLGGNRTLGAPSNVPEGQSGMLRVIQDATGGRTLSFNSVFKFEGGTAPTLSTGADDEDAVPYHAISSTEIWIGFKGDMS